MATTAIITANSAFTYFSGFATCRDEGIANENVKAVVGANWLTAVSTMDHVELG